MGGQHVQASFGSAIPQNHLNPSLILSLMLQVVEQIWVGVVIATHNSDPGFCQ